MTYMVRVTS